MKNGAFKRVGLAKAYCDSLEGKGIANAASGLFLTGPRRVGKSTFLREDIMPEARRRGWLVIYVDLWADKLKDPALLLIEAIKNCFNTQKGKCSKSGLPEQITLVDLLMDLIHISNKRIVLIIDEAQHALTTSQGINAMFSIKSARDQINTPSHEPHLMLVLTSSHRDKLAQLVIKKDQPFFGSEITAFPLLG